MPTRPPASPSSSSCGAASSGVSERTFDGVICFGGEDYWYHNRGHYDMQMMRELSVRVPVLYVNSIGMRVPKVGEGRVFLQRIVRKLKSLRQGMVRVRPGFGVFSPVVAPARMGRGLSRVALALQVRRQAKRMGITRPLVWVACPPGAEVVDRLNPAAVVYQRTDRFEAFDGVDPVWISSLDRRLKRRADMTFFCSSWLMGEESDQCVRAAFVDHGVDSADFEAAGQSSASEPPDTRGLPRPRVGFIGGVDAHTFDVGLFTEVVKGVPEAHFVVVGGCSLPEGWLREPNVTFLGRKQYNDVPGYMAACDVLVMPWNQNDWIRACNPVKLKEYLAVGRPIVTTPFPELSRYQGHVTTACDGVGFTAQVKKAIADAPSFNPAPGRDLVRAQTWTAKADAALAALRGAGVVCWERGEG